MKYKYLIIFFTLIFFSCNTPGIWDAAVLEKAVENGKSARESFKRSLDFTRAWLEKTDPQSGLIPSNLTRKIDLWEPANSAADNYPFMVLTAYLLDKDLYEGKLLDLLNQEKKLTSRVGTLPDVYSFSKRDFLNDEIDLGSVIFGASEYIKDGFMPLTELIGASPWQDRMLAMLDGLHERINDFESLNKYFTRASSVEEINGEMLQTLSRVYWMTGDQKYLDWAIEIADHYLLATDFSRVDYLKLRDHGCEIIGGLSELYMSLHLLSHPKKLEYQPALYRLLDQILVYGRNPDGLFYNAINLKTKEVIDERIADTWGYTLNAYYTVWMTDQKEEYLRAVLKPFKSLNNNYRNYEWEPRKGLEPLGSHDGYADAIESGINLYNRERDPQLKTWIDSEMQVLFGMQQPSGIVEGWHGDGNFARTALMYGLWKTQGAHLEPWQPTVALGASVLGSQTFFVISAEEDWEGQLIFDRNRHQTILKLPLDYPRINQFPEWFTIDSEHSYKITSDMKKLNGVFKAGVINEGIKISLTAGERCVVVIEKKPRF